MYLNGYFDVIYVII